MKFQVCFEIFVFVLPFGSVAGMEGDEGHGAFAPFGVWASDDGGFQDIRMGD